jgi:hypothetical protein
MKQMISYLTKKCAGSGIRQRFIPDPGGKNNGSETQNTAQSKINLHNKYRYYVKPFVFCIQLSKGPLL